MNPFNSEQIPDLGGKLHPDGLWYGRDHAVPAHDERDYEFAKKYNIDIKVVIYPRREGDAPMASQTSQSCPSLRPIAADELRRL